MFGIQGCTLLWRILYDRLNRHTRLPSISATTPPTLSPPAICTQTTPLPSRTPHPSSQPSLLSQALCPLARTPQILKASLGHATPHFQESAACPVENRKENPTPERFVGKKKLKATGLLFQWLFHRPASSPWYSDSHVCTAARTRRHLDTTCSGVTRSQKLRDPGRSHNIASGDMKQAALKDETYYILMGIKLIPSCSAQDINHTRRTRWRRRRSCQKWAEEGQCLL